MSNPSVIMPALALKGLIRAAAKDGSRPCLNGLYINFGAQHACCTDGHRLVLTKIESTGEGEVIIPRALVEQAVKMAGKRGSVEITALPVVGSLRNVELAVNGQTLIAQAMDERFPDFLRVLPEEVSGDYAAFNPDHMADAATSLREISGESRLIPNVAMNGLGPALIFSPEAPDVIVIVMPLRTGVTDPVEAAAGLVRRFKEPAARAEKAA